MRIVYVCSEYYPGQTAVAVRSRFNVEALVDAGQSVVVLTAKVDGVTPEPAKDSEVQHINVQPPDNSKGLINRLVHEMRLGFAFGWRIVTHYRKFDFFILTSPPFFGMVIPAFVCFLFSRRYVFDVRDRYPQVFFSLGLLRRDSYAGRILLALERFIYRHSAMVTTVTSALAKEIANETQIVPKVVMNGFDATVVLQGVDVRKSGAPKVIFMHGLFGRLFDINSFVDIVRYCGVNAGPHQFVIAGYGPGIQEITEMKLKNLSYVGHLSHQEVLQHLAKADFGLSVHTNQPSTNAGFAVKVFEFIGAGIPSIVIPKNESGIEVEREGLGWSFDNSQSIECARLIADLIDDRIDTKPFRDNLHLKRSRYSRQVQSAIFANYIKEFDR